MMNRPRLTADQDPAVARLLSAGLQQEQGGWLVGLLTVVFVLVIGWGIALGAYALTLTAEWLFWPVVVMLVIATTLMLLASLLRISDRHKRDTLSASTVGGASEGIAKVVGRVAAIPGLELHSMTFGVPVVFIDSQVSSVKTGKNITRLRKRHACLVRDESAEVFVPGERLHDIHGKFLGEKKLDAIDPLYEAPARWTAAKGPYQVFEKLVPVDIPVLVVGAFLTIRANESYLMTQARYLNDPEPTPAQLETDADEIDWRFYADTMTKSAPTLGEPPTLNVMVKPKGFNTVQITALDQEHNLVSNSIDFLLGWLVAAPCVLVLAFLFEYTTPEQTIDWLQGLWQQFKQAVPILGT